MKRRGSTLAAGIAGAFALGSAIAAAADKPQFGAWGVDLTAVDAGVRPGDDFNRYASGKWLDRTSIPADKPIASLRYLMTDLTEARLHELMEAAAKDPGDESTLQEKIGGFYKSFMDESRIQKLGAGPIRAELVAVRQAKNRQDLAKLMGRNTADFYSTLFNLGIDVDLKDVSRYALYVGQAGLGLPDRDYYLKSSFAPQKAAYQTYVETLLTLIGWPEPNSNAAAVVDFDPHSPRGFRVIGPTRNVDEWYEAFGIKPGDKYFLPPEQRVRIW